MKKAPEKKFFKEVDYEGVKVFVHKGLKVKPNASVYTKKKLPFLPPMLEVEGVS